MIVMRSTHQQDAACADLAQIEHMLRDNVECVSAQLDRICNQVDEITAHVDGIHRELQQMTVVTYVTANRLTMHPVLRPCATRTFLDPIDLPPSWLYQDGIAGFKQEPIWHR